MLATLAFVLLLAAPRGISGSDPLQELLDRASSLSPESSFQGCYSFSTSFVSFTSGKSSGPADKFDFASVHTDQMMNQRCARVCNHNGYPLSGTTTGSQCFCGSELPTTVYAYVGAAEASGPQGRCSSYCTGAYKYSAGTECKGDYCCGGNGAFSIYYTGEMDAAGHVLNRVFANLRKDKFKLLKGLLYKDPRSENIDTSDKLSFTIEVIHKQVNSSGAVSNEKISLTYKRQSSSISAPLQIYWSSEFNNSLKPTIYFQTISKSTEHNKEISEDSGQSTPLSYSIILDNRYSNTTQQMTKAYSSANSFTTIHSVKSGISSSVKDSFGESVTIGVGSDHATVDYRQTVQVGSFYSTGQKTESSQSTTDQFGVILEAPPYTLAKMDFSSNPSPKISTWSTTMLADGFVGISVSMEGADATTFVRHVGELMNERDRTFFVLGNSMSPSSPAIQAVTTIR